MRYLLLLLSFLTVGILSAQNQYIDFNVKVFEPTGQLNRNITQTPIGINFGYWREMGRKLSLGADMGVAMYSSESYNVSTPGGSVRVEEEDCFWTIHASSRYFIQAVPGVRPFIEGRIGVTTFFSSQTALEETNHFDDTFDFHGTAFNSALGVGVLTDFKQLFKKEPGSVLFNLGWAYHTGSRANYRNMDTRDTIGPATGRRI